MRMKPAYLLKKGTSNAKMLLIGVNINRDREKCWFVLLFLYKSIFQFDSHSSFDISKHFKVNDPDNNPLKPLLIASHCPHLPSSDPIG
jgi:hypothetical protein